MGEQKLHDEYHRWLRTVFGKVMKGKQKRVNKAKRQMAPSELVHPNPLIRNKAIKINQYQRRNG